MNRKGGFSILEVLIALFILAAILLASSSLIFKSAMIADRGTRETEAMSLAQGKLEELKAEALRPPPDESTPGGFDTLASGADPAPLNPDGSAGGHYTRSWTVTSDTPEPFSKTIVVTVTWSSPEGAPSITLSSIVSDLIRG